MKWQNSLYNINPRSNSKKGFSSLKNKLGTMTKAYLESANEYINPM
ncbi:hypothetical protein MY9_0766 [Bacillus sp. JS]|nr:hypothetical protein MY9_0766 [Bacillus sp. JS]